MIDPRIPLMGQQQQDTFVNLAQGIQMGQGLRQLISGRQLGKMQQLAPEDRQAFADKSMFSRELNAGIRANNAAQVAQAMALQKHNADVGNTNAQALERTTNAGKVNQETTVNRQRAISSAMAAAMSGSPQAANFMLEHGKSGGILDENSYAQAKQFLTENANNPQAISSLVQSLGIAAAEKPEQYIQPDANNVNTNTTSITNNELDNKTSRANNEATVGATLEGQKVQKGIADARLKFEKDQAEKPKFVKEITAPDGTVYGIYSDGSADVMSTKSGDAIKGQSGASKMTEQQSKDALFGGRMQEANKILLNLEGKGIKAPVMNSLPYGGKFSNALPGILGGASAEQQQYVQAQRDFINAVLRKESGAVIADSEFENAQKQYFPQIGDSPAVITQKAKNRELALTMIVNASGIQGREQIDQAVGNKGVPYANTEQQPQGNNATQKAFGSASSKWGI